MTAGTLLYEGKAKKIFTTGDRRTGRCSISRTTQQRSTRRSAARSSRKASSTTRCRNGFFGCWSKAACRRISSSGRVIVRCSRKKSRLCPSKSWSGTSSPAVWQNDWGLKEGEAIQPAIVEWYYKNDALGDPLISDEHVRLLKAGDTGATGGNQAVGVESEQPSSTVLRRTQDDFGRFQIGIRPAQRQADPGR